MSEVLINRDLDFERTKKGLAGFLKSQFPDGFGLHPHDYVNEILVFYKDGQFDKKALENYLSQLDAEDTMFGKHDSSPHSSEDPKMALSSAKPSQLIMDAIASFFDQPKISRNN